MKFRKKVEERTPLFILSEKIRDCYSEERKAITKGILVDSRQVFNELMGSERWHNYKGKMEYKIIGGKKYRLVGEWGTWFLGKSIPVYYWVDADKYIKL